jgi:hypothetical protein
LFGGCLLLGVEQFGHRCFGEVAAVADLPFVVDFGEDGAGEAQQRRWVGEDADDVGAALDLFVDTFEPVGDRYEGVGVAGSVGLSPVVSACGSAYGATVRDRGAGSEAGWVGRSCSMGWEPALVLGRPCDLPGCAARADP